VYIKGRRSVGWSVGLGAVVVDIKKVGRHSTQSGGGGVRRPLRAAGVKTARGDRARFLAG